MSEEFVNYCSYCGHSNENDADFCDACGRAVDKPCPSCGIVNIVDARFCDGCGEALSVHCPTCHTKNPPNSQFCDECGTSFIPAKRPRRVRYAVIGSAVLIAVLVFAFIFWPGDEPQTVSSSYSECSSQRSSSSPSYSSTNSEPEYEDFASIKFGRGNIFSDLNLQLSISCPSNVGVFSNDGDIVSINAYSGNIRGRYSFVYSYDDYELAFPEDKKTRKIIRGSFIIDGEYRRYDVLIILGLGSDVDVTCTGY